MYGWIPPQIIFVYFLIVSHFDELAASGSTSASGFETKGGTWAGTRTRDVAALGTDTRTERIPAASSHPSNQTLPTSLCHLGLSSYSGIQK